MKSQAGLSYVEILVAVLLIALSLLPALDALRAALLGSEIHAVEAYRRRHLASKMEEVLARPWSALEFASGQPPDAPGWLSDPVAQADRRLVFVRGYDLDDADSDADPFTGADEDVLWIRVQLQNTELALQTLTHRELTPP